MPQGDVTCNGAVDLFDAMAVLELILGERSGVTTCPSNPADPVVYLPACDMDGDGLCGETDALIVLQCGGDDARCVDGVQAQLQARASHAAATQGQASSATPTERVTYMLDGRPVAVKVSGHPDAETNGVFYLHTDHLGSVTAMTDESGALVDGSVSRFYPFGAYREQPDTNPAVSDRGYTGHRHNDDLGLVYMQARWYAPELRRFISADTIVPEPGNPQAFNRYAYTYQNPINLVDPTGHCAGVYNDPTSEGYDAECWAAAEDMHNRFGFDIRLFYFTDLHAIQMLDKWFSDDGLVPGDGLLFNPIDWRSITVSGINLAANSFFQSLDEAGMTVESAAKILGHADAFGFTAPAGAAVYYGVTGSLWGMFNMRSGAASVGLSAGGTAGLTFGFSGGVGLSFGFNLPDNSALNEGFATGFTTGIATPKGGFGVGLSAPGRLVAWNGPGGASTSNGPTLLSGYWSAGVEADFFAYEITWTVLAVQYDVGKADWSACAIILGCR